MWLYDGREVTDEDLEGNYGFVYLIRNRTTGRKYIGKKLLFFRRSKTLKGKRKRYLIESDWKDYWGSNKELQEEVTLLGPDAFERQILRLCKTKSECSYWEAKHQFETDCLLSADYYNDWISVKVTRTHMKKKEPSKK